MTQDGLNKQEELTPWSKRRADNVGHSFCGQDVRLENVYTRLLQKIDAS